jgi:hypothetical protein
MYLHRLCDLWTRTVIMYLPFSMSIKLENKVAVITGATSGMALATAKIFVEEGAYVFITGRSQEWLDNAIKEIGKNEKGRIDVLFVSTVFYTVFVVVYNEEYTIKRLYIRVLCRRMVHKIDNTMPTLSCACR